VAAASVEVLTGKGVAVDLKGMVEPLELAEILGVGLPYDLLLESVQCQWQAVQPPIALKLSLMAAKQVADQGLTGLLVAVAGEQLRLQSTEPLALLADVRVEGLIESCYAKITDKQDDIYTLTVTSATAGLRNELSKLPTLTS
jgi:hypothetical protein